MHRSKTKKIISGTMLSMAKYLRKITPLKIKRRSKSTQGLRKIHHQETYNPIVNIVDKENSKLDINDEEIFNNLEIVERKSPVIESGEVDTSSMVVCTETNPKHIHRKGTAKVKSIPILSKYENNKIRNYEKLSIQEKSK